MINLHHKLFLEIDFVGEVVALLEELLVDGADAFEVAVQIGCFYAGIGLDLAQEKLGGSNRVLFRLIVSCGLLQRRVAVGVAWEFHKLPVMN